jgi:ribosomal protein S27E
MPNDEREADVVEDRATISAECDVCGATWLWFLDDPTTMRCPDCPDDD